MHEYFCQQDASTPLGVPDMRSVENAAVYFAKRTIQHL